MSFLLSDEYEHEHVPAQDKVHSHFHIHVSAVVKIMCILVCKILLWKRVLFIASPSTAERGSWMGGWTTKGAVTYFRVQRQSSGTHSCSVGDDPDSIHGFLSSLPSLDLFRSCVLLFLFTAVAVNGDTSFMKGARKKNETAVIKYLAIFVLLQQPVALQETPTANNYHQESMVAESFFCP